MYDEVDSDSDDDFAEEDEQLLRKHAKENRNAESEDDEYEHRIKGLNQIEHVPKFVQKLMRSIGKPASVNRLLDRLNATDSQPVLRRLVQFHGLLALKAALHESESDAQVYRKVLAVLQKLPISTRNTVEAAKVEPLLTKLSQNDDCVVSALAGKVMLR